MDAPSDEDGDKMADEVVNSQNPICFSVVDFYARRRAVITSHYLNFISFEKISKFSIQNSVMGKS